MVSELQGCFKWIMFAHYCSITLPPSLRPPPAFPITIMVYLILMLSDVLSVFIDRVFVNLWHYVWLHTLPPVISCIHPPYLPLRPQHETTTWNHPIKSTWTTPLWFPCYGACTWGLAFAPESVDALPQTRSLSILTPHPIAMHELSLQLWRHHMLDINAHRHGNMVIVVRTVHGGWHGDRRPTPWTLLGRRGADALPWMQAALQVSFEPGWRHLLSCGGDLSYFNFSTFVPSLEFTSCGVWALIVISASGFNAYPSWIDHVLSPGSRLIFCLHKQVHVFHYSSVLVTGSGPVTMVTPLGVCSYAIIGCSCLWSALTAGALVQSVSVH